MLSFRFCDPRGYGQRQGSEGANTGWTTAGRDTRQRRDGSEGDHQAQDLAFAAQANTGQRRESEGDQARGGMGWDPVFAAAVEHRTTRNPVFTAAALQLQQRLNSACACVRVACYVYATY